MQNAPLALACVWATWAISRHPEVAERKIVLHRIVGIELAQRGGDLLGRGPRRRAAIGEPEVTADPMNVGVDRYHELGGRDRPEAQIDAVSRANHPSRVENETFARTSGPRIADQVSQAPADGIAPKVIGKTSQSFAEVSIAGTMVVDERISERPVPTAHRTGSPQDGRDVLSPIDPVHEPLKPGTKLRVTFVHDGCRRFRAEGKQNAIDAAPSGDSIPKRKARRDESHDLLVTRFFVAVDAIDRISASGRLRVAISEQRVQAFADTVHFAGVLAILPT